MNNNLINGFSVIMPLYCNENPDNFIQSMNSLLNQTLCPNEIIVVVDGEVGPKLNKAIEILNNPKEYQSILSVRQN